MAITHGSLSARVWRVTEALPPHFQETFERNIKRYAFKPINADKGETHSVGWVNPRQVLDHNLNLNKVLMNNTIVIAYRLDRITLNARAYKATLFQETQKAEREVKPQSLTSDQREALKDKVKLDMLKVQSPSMAVYEIAWKLETGLVFFGASGAKLNENLADLFTQTFGVGLEPQLPYIRGERWAKRQKLDRELREVLPAPFSPEAPAEVVTVEPTESES